MREVLLVSARDAALNIGDTIIANGLRSELMSRTSVRELSSASLLKLVVKGTPGLILLPPGQSLAKPLRAAPRVLAQLGLIAAFRALGFRVARLGHSFASTTICSRWAERGTAALVNHYGVRDRATMRRAASVGVSNVSWFADWSWHLPAPQLLPFRERRRVVVSLRDNVEGYRPVSVIARRTIDRVEQLVAAAAVTGLTELVIAEHDRHDARFLREVARRLRGEVLVVNPGNIDRIYGDAALVISNRLHSLLFAVQHGAVPLALIDSSKHTKIMDNLEDLDLLGHVMDLDDDEVDLPALLDRHEIVASCVASYRARARSVAQTTLDRLLG